MLPEAPLTVPHMMKDLSPPMTTTALSQVPQELTEDSGDFILRRPGDIPVSSGDSALFFRAAPSRESRNVLEPTCVAVPKLPTPPSSVLTTVPAKLRFLGGTGGSQAAAEALLPAPQQETALKWKFFPLPWKGPTLPRTFSRVHAFSLVSFAALAVPLAMAHELSTDATAYYFAGPWAYLAPLALVFATAGHAAHIHAGKLSVVPAVIGTIPGPLVLAVVGNAYVRSTLGELPDMLASKDCAWYDVDKLYISRKEAERVYNDCLAQHELKFQDADVEKLFRFQECKTYLQDHSKPPTPSILDGIWHALSGPHRYSSSVNDAYADHRAAWRYFERLEEEQQCSGWCEASRPFWTTQKTKDSCSSVAGFVMKYKVRPTAYGLLAYSVSIIVVALVGIWLLVVNGLVA